MNIRGVSLFLDPDLAFGWKQVRVGCIRRCRSENAPIGIIVDLTRDPADVLLVASDLDVTRSTFLACLDRTGSVICALCNSFILWVHRAIIVAGLPMLVLS